MNKKDKKKYFCSIYGGDGDPDCRECWAKLYELAKDNNALVLGP